mgnify:CR=1 FL=1
MTKIVKIEIERPSSKRAEEIRDKFIKVTNRDLRALVADEMISVMAEMKKGILVTCDRGIATRLLMRNINVIFITEDKAKNLRVYEIPLWKLFIIVMLALYKGHFVTIRLRKSDKLMKYLCLKFDNIEEKIVLEEY